jgi:hypothetical protein
MAVVIVGHATPCRTEDQWQLGIEIVANVPNASQSQRLKHCSKPKTAEYQLDVIGSLALNPCPLVRRPTASTVRTGEPPCRARRRVALHHLPDLLDRLVDAQALREVLPEGGVPRLSPKAPVEALTSWILDWGLF